METDGYSDATENRERYVEGIRVEINVVERSADKAVVEVLIRKEKLLYEYGFVGRKERGSIDLVMVIDKPRKGICGKV